jgi:hypothetical protein
MASENEPGPDQHVLDRIDERIGRCNRKANQARFFTLSLKAIQITLAGTIPILALVNPHASQPGVNGILGTLIVVIEGFQHSFKFEQFWIRYRQGAYELEGERSLYLAKAGPYRDPQNAHVLFAERVDSAIQKHVGNWADSIQKTLANSG